jgi:DNA repair protein SbcD/Mre11
MLRVLLLADTHLGFDLPARPRSDRVRRGPDFFACFEQALEPARRGQVDMVVHGGDLLFRSRVPGSLVARALEPLLAIADLGVPVVLVPGNHERSSLPYPLLAAHEHVHVFDRPRTIRLRVGGQLVALAGFPCERDGIAGCFSGALAATGWLAGADVCLLCLHQTVEGARVGPAGFTFRHGPDVLPGPLVPAGFAAVLAGHIHRAQVLRADLAGRPLRAPVVYPGSTERTSFAERYEPKGFMVLDLAPDPLRGGHLAAYHFHELPARPMAVEELVADGLGPNALAEAARDRLRRLPPGTVVQLRVRGRIEGGSEAVLRVANLRQLVPPGVLCELRVESAQADRY